MRKLIVKNVRDMRGYFCGYFEFVPSECLMGETFP